MQLSDENSYKLKTLKLSMIAISSVVLVEVLLGLIVSSLAIISDGLHALLDTLTTFALFIATRASLRPPDEEHMYGHEKFESIGGLVAGFALIGVSILIMYEAIVKLAQNTPLNLDLKSAGFIAIGYTFCIDFFRVGTFIKARHSESSTMKAGLYHAVADMSSTVIALLGFGLATLGYNNGDTFASMILSVLLAYLSVKLILGSGMELTDAISKNIIEKVRKEILKTKGIYKYQNLKVRKAGAKIFVRATIQVSDYMSLEEAHALASKAEENIKNSLGNAEVMIHVEPPETEISTEKQVEKLAAQVEGVKAIHEVTKAYVNGKLYLTLHACVDSKLSVEEAHKKAEEVENKIIGKIKGIENITVHIEPFDEQKQRGTTADEDEIKKIVLETAELWQGAIRIKKIITYTAGNKRYINIDCCFTRKISIEDAHKIASEIEDQVRNHFAEVIVTVHMEPRSSKRK